MDFPHYSGEPQSEDQWFQALLSLARYLRTPDGCPWDREQGAQEFCGFLAGEVAELQEALGASDMEHVEEEFGDVLFTLLATIAAAEDRAGLDVTKALERIHGKMIRRHEHVFGDARADTPEDATRIWNEVKAREKAARRSRESE